MNEKVKQLEKILDCRIRVLQSRVLEILHKKGRLIYNLDTKKLYPIGSNNDLKFNGRFHIDRLDDRWNDLYELIKIKNIIDGVLK